MERNIEAFNKDVDENEGYLYSTNPSLSSRLAHQRYTDAIFELVDFKDKTVIDVGSGDGTYTMGLLDKEPKSVLGIDPAQRAVEIASGKAAGLKSISFQVESAYELPFENDSFDIAHLRAVLHHLDEPERAVKEALRVARSIVVLEPNGYSPLLKMNEKISPYHRQHDEKSFTAARLRQWTRNGGGEIVRHRWVGFVPTFCSDTLARVAKTIEPALEAVPAVSKFACAVYVYVAEKPTPRA